MELEDLYRYRATSDEKNHRRNQGSDFVKDTMKLFWGYKTTCLLIKNNIHKAQ